MDVPFNKVSAGAREYDYLRESLASGRISGDGPFTHKCHAFLEAIYGSTVLLMHSCTAALEAATILADLKPGDEVIMPSFTFVSTANAVVLRGAVPVFVDIRPDTLNIDETLIRAAVTRRTRAIMPVHYAGIGAAMTEIAAIARDFDLTIIEDAAQGFGATLDSKPLGAFGAMGCLSFHETKNVVSGEGGALLLNDPALVDRAQFIREKGTNRTQFLRREVMKYEWVDIGSSFLPSDLLAAVLLAQLERSDAITARRREIWARYHAALASIAGEELFRLPQPPANAIHNAHLFGIVAATPEVQRAMIAGLKADGIAAPSHYVPLHNSPAGLRFARTSGDLPVTEHVATSLFRLPLHAALTDAEVDFTIARTLHHAGRMIETAGAKLVVPQGAG
jgi:dTDP-4-amino-4,6-dideoxygalactose transaminase